MDEELLRQVMAWTVDVPQRVPWSGSGRERFVQRPHPGHQAAVTEDIQYLRAHTGDRVGRAVADDLPAYLHLHSVAFPAAVIQVPALDQQQAVVDECGQKAVEYERYINRSGDEEIMSRWQKENGVTITQNEDMDIDSFKKAVDGIDEWYQKELEDQGYDDAKELIAAFQ